MDAGLQPALARGHRHPGGRPGRHPQRRRRRDPGVPGRQAAGDAVAGPGDAPQADGLRRRGADPRAVRRLPRRRAGAGRRIDQGPQVRPGAPEGGRRQAEGSGGGRRHVGHPDRHPPGPGRRALPDRRQERRRRRHLVREHLSGLPGRQRKPHVQLLLRAQPPLAAALLAAAGAARLLPRHRGEVRLEEAHPLRDPGRDPCLGRRPLSLARDAEG